MGKKKVPPLEKRTNRIECHQKGYRKKRKEVEKYKTSTLRETSRDRRKKRRDRTTLYNTHRVRSSFFLFFWPWMVKLTFTSPLLASAKGKNNKIYF